MSYRLVDQSTWARAEQYRMFRGYARPHYATTTRLDVSRLTAARKRRGVSPYRASLFAIGAAIHGVDALCMRFVGEEVRHHDRIDMSVTVPKPDGNFNYAYFQHLPDFPTFDRVTADLLAEAAQRDALGAAMGERNDLAFLSCMPWLDYTSINNALPGPDDCIPRISWGKIVEESPDHWRMAMTLEVHHALVDGADVGAFFDIVQSHLNTF